jgi:uncharacterized flavoprotein (TIGR03862 family)
MVTKSFQDSEIAVIGGGPAGLMAAEVISTAGIKVDLFDSMPSMGRKFLVAGKGGLNLTHSEPAEIFLSNYGIRRNKLEPILEQFGPQEVRKWAQDKGIETFVGSSNRVFPKNMKTGPLLRSWLEQLKSNGVNFIVNHEWTGWNTEGSLRFKTAEGERCIQAKATVLALGGGSYKHLGSTGKWVQILRNSGVSVSKLMPANCGFNVAWSNIFRTRYEGQPVKSVLITFTDSRGKHSTKKGEFIITEYGVEGSLIYAFSSSLRDELEMTGKAALKLDLAPDWSRESILERLSLPRGSQSIANHLRKKVKIHGVKAGLLWEFVPKGKYTDVEYLSRMIKELPLPLISPRPLDEAISSAGGVVFNELDESLMLKSLPGVFCAGEMLDWEAPTGGYLITACLATGQTAGFGALSWLESHP